MEYIQLLKNNRGDLRLYLPGVSMDNGEYKIDAELVNGYVLCYSPVCSVVRPIILTEHLNHVTDSAEDAIAQGIIIKVEGHYYIDEGLNLFDEDPGRPSQEIKLKEAIQLKKWKEQISQTIRRTTQLIECVEEVGRKCFDNE